MKHGADPGSQVAGLFRLTRGRRLGEPANQLRVTTLLYLFGLFETGRCGKQTASAA